MLKHQRKGRLEIFRLDWRVILEKRQSLCDVTLIQFAEDRCHWQTPGMRCQQPWMAVYGYMFVKLNHNKLPLAEWGNHIKFVENCEQVSNCVANEFLHTEWSNHAEFGRILSTFYEYENYSKILPSRAVRYSTDQEVLLVRLRYWSVYGCLCTDTSNTCYFLSQLTFTAEHVNVITIHIPQFMAWNSCYKQWKPYGIRFTIIEVEYLSVILNISA